MTVEKVVCPGKGQGRPLGTSMEKIKFAGNFVMARLNFKVAGQFPSCIVFFKGQQYIFVGYALAVYREIPKYFGPVQHVHTVQAGSPCRKLE